MIRIIKMNFVLISIMMFTGVNHFGQNFGNINPEPDFFPIAVWMQGASSASAYKSHGINMFIGAELNEKTLKIYKELDVKIICEQNGFGLKHIKEKVIYAWMHGDEPDNAQWNKTTRKYDPCMDPFVIINSYEEIKKRDPSRPVYLNLGQGVSYINYNGRGACRGDIDKYKVSSNGYLKGCDIASFDIYPVNNTDAETKGNLWYVAKGIDNLIEWTENSKPVWCWIETTKIAENSTRKPTPSEVRTEVWMALIHGASGFGYFCHSWTPSFDEQALLHDPEMIEAVREINEQVTSLAEVLNSRNTDGYASVSSSNTSIPIDIMTKRHDKANYIFAVAMRPGNTTATFKISSGSRVEVLGEDRIIEASEGVFSDEFSSYGVRLYKITK